MATTWGDLRTTLNQRRLDSSTTTLDIDVAGLQAANDFLQDLKMVMLPNGLPHYWDFDIRRTILSFYYDIEEYALPSDFLHIQDLQAQTQNFYHFRYFSPERFDVARANEEFDDFFAVVRREGAEFLRFNYAHTLTDNADVHQATGFDTNGTWTADTTTSDATNVTTDAALYKLSPGSVNFDVDVSQSGNNLATIYVPDMSVVDASDYDEQGSFVMWTYIPDVTNVSSFDLFWGSDSSSTPATRANYWTRNVTTQANGTAFANGWNQLRFNWNGATETGTVVPSTLRYLEFRVNYGAGQADDTDFRINNIRLNNPEEIEVYYYTQHTAQSTAGTYQAALTTAGGNTDETLFSDQYDWMRNVVVEGTLEKIFQVQEREKERQRAEKRRDELLMYAMKRLPSRARHPELPPFVPFQLDTSSLV